MSSLNKDPNKRGRPPVPLRVTSQNPVLHSSSSQSPLDLSRSGQTVGNPRFPSQVTPITQIDSQQWEWDITPGQQQRPPPATSVSQGTFAYSTRSSSGSPSSASSVCGSLSGCGSSSSISDYREHSEITGAQDPSRQKCVCHLYCSQHASEYCPRHLSSSSSSGGSCVIM